MKNQTLPEDIFLKFITMLYKNITRTGGEKYPVIWPFPIIHIAEAEIYTAKFIVEHLYNVMVKIRSSNKYKITLDIIKPSRIAMFFWFFRFGKRTSELTQKQLRELFEWLLGLIYKLRIIDPLVFGGKNILLNAEKIEEIVEDLNNKYEIRDKISLGKLNSLLFNLTELLFFAGHSIAHEFHGPYEIDNSTYLLIREYYDLKPQIWNFTKLLNFEKIIIYEFYDMNKVKIKLDFFNRIFSNVSPITGLKKSYVFVDGRNIKDISDLISDQLLKTFREATSYINKFFFGDNVIENKVNTLTKFLEAFFYATKPLCSLAGMDWRPPKEAYETISRLHYENHPILKDTLKLFKRFEKSDKHDEKIKILYDMFIP